MMRRSRISIKPNFRPGNRPATEAPQVSQGASEAGDTLPAGEAEEGARRAQSPQNSMALVELSEDVGCKEAPEMPSEMNQNDGAPSSGATTSSAAPPRRMRISATPKLVRPKLTSTPQTRRSARLPSLVSSPLPNEKHLHDSASISKSSDDPPESGTPKRSTSPPELPPQSPTTRSPSPCVPSTSGLRKRQVSGGKSVDDSPPSPQPGQVPQQPSQEPEAPECLSSSEPSPASAKSSHVDKLDSSEMTEKSSDKDRILRALKLKELMKIERRKDIQMGKRRVGQKVYTALDRSKMTMRDLIYYLPNTSPMRSSAERAENQEENIIPPSPKQQIKTTELDDEEESENEEMLVPKVRVAEDGSIILDEDSLTVRVERTSNTKVVENSMALFECGFTTTYTSFREATHVKSWSVRETDLFFLAISMVGTDFTLIGQLLTHRSRKAIKNKFKKEERVNPWRVDKALRNKRPYDKEFFSYLLEKVLAKDKDKRKSVRLILPKTKKPRKSRGKKANQICVSDDDDDDDEEYVFYADNLEDLEHDGDVGLEKENKDVSNVKEDSAVPAKKRRKRRRDKNEDKDTSTEDQVKRKRQRKCSRKTTSEVHSRDDADGESDHNVEGETTHVTEEDEGTSAPKRRLRRPMSDDENQKKKPAKGRKGKQLKKSQVACDHHETVSDHEESSVITNEDGSAIKKKRKRAKNGDLDGDEPAKEKKNTKRNKALKSTAEEEGAVEEGDPSADLPEAEKSNAPVTAEVADNVPPKATRRSKKALPNVATKRSKQPEASPEVERESQEENNHESILSTSGSPLQDERLQMQAVVLLEKTPPRQQHLLSPSNVQRKNNELETPTSTPASPSSSRSSSSRQTRMQRAGRVKRDLSSSGTTRGGKGLMDQDEAEESPMVLLESIVQESEQDDTFQDQEQDDTFNENLMDLSCLHDFDSQMLQRRPMVVLSREEVDMVLNASDQSDDEDPSVSPLDLSLNTELSFPLQCSRLLEDNEDDDDEEAEVDCVLEAHEERINERAPCEERNCEELELTKSALGQTEISDLRDISTSANPEVCSQPDVDLSKGTTSFPPEEVEPQVHPTTYEDVTVVEAELEGSQPLVLLDNEDPVCMKPDAPMTQETVTTETPTLDTSLEDSDDVEESEETILKPTSPKEPALASSEITAQPNPTPTESEPTSQRQETPEVKGELQMSSQTLETLQDSSENKDGTQESAMASSEIKARIAPEVRDDSQEEVSVQSSSASVAPEHGIRPTRRSKFLPKPNLSQKSRATPLQNQGRDLQTKSSLKPETSEPTISTEKLLYSTTNEQHDGLEDLSKQNLTKEEETSQPDAVDQMELTKDVSDASTAVPDQENITTVTADEPQPASECSSSRRDVDMMPSCTSLTSPQPSETREDTGPGQMNVPCEDVCAPAEMIHFTEDGHNDEEPTFILTLYEIPVTQAYTPLSCNDLAMTSDLPTFETQASMGLSDQAHTLPSTSVLSIVDPLPMESNAAENPRNDSRIVAEDAAENGKEQISARAASHEVTSPHPEDEDSDASAAIPPLGPHSECSKTSESAPCDDLAPRIQSTPSGYSDSTCITALSQDSEQCESVSPMVLGDVPVSEEMEDESSKDRTMDECKLESKEVSPVCPPKGQDTPYEEPTKVDTVESKDTPSLSEEKKAPAKRRERKKVKPQPKLVKRARAKDDSSETDQLVEEPTQSASSHADSPASHDETLAGPSNTTNEKSPDQTAVSGGKDVKPKSITEESPKTSQGDLESTESKSISTSLYLSKEPEPDEESSDDVTGDTTVKDDMELSTQDKELSIWTSDEGGNVQPGCEDMPLNLMKTSGSGSSTVDSKETEAETEGVSHMVLPDVFVFVSGETDGDLCDDCTVSIESSPQRVSLPESGADLRQELGTEDVSQTLTEESTQNQSTLMDIKTPVRKRGKQRAKRTGPKHESTKTSQPTSPHATAPPSSRLTTPPENENVELLEEKLQRRHHITPCSIRLSRLDNAAQSLSAPELEDGKSIEEPTVKSSRTCHVRVTTLSEESKTLSLFEEMKLESPELERKSPTRRKVSESTRDDSSKDRTMSVESKLQGKEASSVSVTEHSAENSKQQTSSDEPILLEMKNKENDASANLETDIPLKDPDSECEKRSEFAPLGDMVLMTESSPSGSNISECITTLPQDPEDTEQCEGVSHTVLDDVFVPVSEEMGDDSSKDKTSSVKSKESKDISSVSLPERRDTPYEELTEVENSPAESNPLFCLDSTEESKDTPSLSEKKKAPAKKRERKKVKPQPKLVKRACAKDDSSETDQLVEEPSQSASSHADSPASHDETPAGPSNTTNEKSPDQTAVSGGKDVMPKSITEESPKTSQGDLESTESKSISTSLYLSKEPEPDEESSDDVTGDTTVKDDMELSTQDKELSIWTSDEGGNVQPGCEDMPLNLMKTSGSGSSTVDSKETEAETEGVSHMVLPDVFVFVSGETDGDLCDDCTVSIESSPQRVSLPESGADLRQELGTEDVSQTLTEESTQNQSTLMDIKTPVRKRGKQRAKRTGPKHESTKTSQPTSPHATAPPSSRLTTPPENENVELLEEKLQRRHHITPCSIRLSSVDTVDPSQLRDRMSSLSCHDGVTTPSEPSPSRVEEMKLEEPELAKKSPTRRKGKKNESSPKRGHLKPVQTASHSRQLTITDWVNKKSCQTETNQEEEEPEKSSQILSSFKTKQVVEKTCSKSLHTDSEELQDSHLAPALEETEEASSISDEVKTPSEVTQGSTGDPSISQVKKSPVRQRAKPVRSKRTCTKREDNTSTTDQPQPTRFTSPTRQHARAAREKEESDNETEQPVKELSDTSSMEADSKTKERGPQSPKSQDTWPRVVLSHVKLQTTESGVRSTSSAPQCSPARVAESSGPPVTPPQLKKSPTQSSSPTTSESPKDPSTVSQFFLYDIFTEVEETE